MTQEELVVSIPQYPESFCIVRSRDKENEKRHQTYIRIAPDLVPMATSRWMGS